MHMDDIDYIAQKRVNATSYTIIIQYIIIPLSQQYYTELDECSNVKYTLQSVEFIEEIYSNLSNDTFEVDGMSLLSIPFILLLD